MEPIVANLFDFGNPMDVAIVAGVVVLLFGGSKLASFGKSLGEGLREFKRAVKDTADEPAKTEEVKKDDAPTAKADKE
jgi:sec-independent protein translocase protein TatA